MEAICIKCRKGEEVCECRDGKMVEMGTVVEIEEVREIMGMWRAEREARRARNQTGKSA